MLYVRCRVCGSESPTLKEDILEKRKQIDASVL
jgi:hypothetical protein